MSVLVVNPGSSSLKLSVLDDTDDVLAAGVRFIHRGPDLSEAVVVDQNVEDRLEAAADLAPLYDPPALSALRVASVFTGGVGENSPRVRADACAGLGFLGVALDGGRNAADDPGDRDIAAAGSRPVLVVRSREDTEFAWEVRRLL